MNTITNLLCLGMYLGLLWYMQAVSKTMTMNIDSMTYYESAYLHWSCQT